MTIQIVTVYKQMEVPLTLTKGQGDCEQ